MNITTRWLLALGIGTVCFGISLFVLRIPIRTIIVFFSIGLPLVALWLYVDVKSKEKKKIDSITAQACICSICNTKKPGSVAAKMCMLPL